MIVLALIAAVVLLGVADLWLVWMTPGVSLWAAADPAMLGAIAGYVWPALLAGAVLALALALPFQARAARRVAQATMNWAERGKAREAGREAARGALAQREQAAEIREQHQTAQADALRGQEAAIEQRVREETNAARQEVKAAQAERQAAEAERDAAWSAQKHAEGMARAAEKRRQNAVAATRRRRDQMDRLRARFAD